MAKVLISDGGNRVSLSLVRALSRSGHVTDVFEISRRVSGHHTPISFRSRGARNKYILPDPDRYPTRYENRLCELLEQYDVFIPVAINTIYFCVTRLDRLRETSCKIPIVEESLLRNSNHTGRLIQMAKQAGLQTPETAEIDPATFSSTEQISFPSVIKLPTDEGFELPPGERYRKISGKGDLEEALQHFRFLSETVLLQEWIEGSGFGFSAVLYPAGKIRGSVCHKRIREYPVTGGPSSFCETVNEPELERAGKNLLTELNWIGPAQVEFRKSRDDGQFYLMEVNPRFWGSLPLSVHAGTNLPDILVRSLNRTDQPRWVKTPAGKRLRFLHLDIPAQLQLLFSGSGEFASWFDCTAGLGILDSNDPVPALSMYMELLSNHT